MEPIVERIKEIIQAQHMTSSAFAQFVGIKQATLSHTLSGRNKKPSIDVVWAISSTCDVSFNWLMEGVEKDMPNFIRVYRGLPVEGAEGAIIAPAAEDEPFVVENGLFDGAISVANEEQDTVLHNSNTPLTSESEHIADSSAMNMEKQPEVKEQSIHADIIPPAAPQEMPTPQVVTQIEYRDTPPRKVREICIYYDDGTYEYFVPRK